MDTLNCRRILDAMAQSATALLEPSPREQLFAYTSLNLLVAKLEDRVDEFAASDASERFWRIRQHADAAMGFTGDTQPVDRHVYGILEAVDELRASDQPVESVLAGFCWKD